MRKPVILIVEDVEAERRILIETLCAIGDYNVYGAPNVERAMAFQEDRIDVVLTDLHMGDEGGMELITKWKEGSAKDAQFIFVTGDRQAGSARDAFKHGAFDYLTKPVKITQLVETIERALAAQNA